MRWTLRVPLAIIPIFALLAIAPCQAQQTDAASNTPKDQQAGTAGNLEVLSNTQGVDFGPYLSKLLQKIRTNWYKFIPDEARPPQLAAGVTSVEFAILKSGQVGGMKIVQGSGMLPLDRAAWGGITASNPFDPLPEQFKGPYLALRMHFFYNPKKLPPNEQPTPAPVHSPVEKPQPH